MDTNVFSGRASVTRAYADKINVDGYSADAPGAVAPAWHQLPAT